ncbi:hypothetical protein [Nonomuraea fuscirosea]|uniref:hypothetical protein n=1 Tax=Nonomuraea fuscirosea TaxID=1291556 RepID=UPI0033FFE43A
MGGQLPGHPAPDGKDASGCLHVRAEPASGACLGAAPEQLRELSPRHVPAKS